jgi:hypothetical protein
VAQNYLKQDQLFHTILHLPVVLAAVSSAVQDILHQEFGRSSLLIPNGIDCERFQPGPYEPQSSSSGSHEAGLVEEHSTTAAAAAAAGGKQQAASEAEAAAADGTSDDSMRAVEAQPGLLEYPAAAAAAGAHRGVGTAAGSTAAADEAQSAAAPMDMLLVAADTSADAAPMDDAPAAAAAAADEKTLSVTLDLSDPHNPSDLAHLQNPGPLASKTPGPSPCGGQKKRVLLVGNPALPLKGFPTAIAALTAVSAVLPIKIRWVCQVRLHRGLGSWGLADVQCG